MEYQLYTTNEKDGKTVYLYEKHNGTHSLCKTKVTCFDYETALKLQKEYANHNLVICDEDSMFFKHISRLDEWKNKIEDKDKLKSEKKEKISEAIDLFYTDETLERIINATTESEICSAMTNARLNSKCA